MGQDEKSLTVRGMEWCEAAERMLATAMKSDPLAGVEALAEMVNGGTAALYGVFSGVYFVGAYVLRVDHKPHGAEGVIVAAAGRLKGVSLLGLLLPEAEKRFHGCKAIRVHTNRRGMLKELSKRGYGLREFVLAKGL